MFLLVALIAGTTVNAYAFTIAQTHIIDNDDAQGYSNSKVGFSKLIQGSNLYYQDARIQQCIPCEPQFNYNEYKYYLQNFYKRYTPIYGTVSAYLYNANFTDPSARYELDSTYAPSVVQNSILGYINQDFAAAGWNIIGTAIENYYYLDGSIGVSGVVLRPSDTNSTKYCGADAIKVELGYN